MKVSQLWLIGLVYCLSIDTIKALRLPEHLYTIQDNKAVTSVTIKESIPIFYLVVPDSSTFPASDPEKISELKAFMKDATIPPDFFARHHPTTETEPIKLFFNWKEKENSKARKQAGTNLAHAINNLRGKFKKSPIVVLGHGQGGNVINVASHSVQKPIDIVIQLATPVYPHNADIKKDLYSAYIPDKKMINQMFAFYSDQSFPVLHPSLHPTYDQFYKTKTHPQLTNILLLVNNKHPLSSETLRPLVGKKLLALCQASRLSYRLHNNLVAHLSTIKPETDMLVFLRDRSLRGVSTRNRATQKMAQERMLSEIRVQNFTKTWGRAPALRLAKGEKTRKRYQQLAGQKKA